MHYIELEWGDYSGDGHDKRLSCVIISNKDKASLEVAYQKGVELIGFDLIEECCTEYEEREFPDRVVEIIKKNSELSEYLSCSECYDLRENQGHQCEEHLNVEACDHWLDLYFHFLKVGDPTLEIETLKPESIYIGGYGLFY